MLIAEGIDWFWWYGDDHSSDHDLVFDELFRRHVRNVYRALDVPVPEELFVSNITTHPPPAGVVAPTGFIHPVIDGEVTSYFEWIGAGSVDIVAGRRRDAPGVGARDRRRRASSSGSTWRTCSCGSTGRRRCATSLGAEPAAQPERS